RNFNEKASSKKPKTTFTLFNHPPDFGSEFIADGNNANKVNGSANAVEKPSILTIGARRSPLVAASTNTEPMIGPVQENETTTRVEAMKKMPSKPPLSEFSSSLLANELGKVISNAPKNEIANVTSSKKKKKLNTPFVANAFRADGPNAKVIMSPS